MLKNHNHDLVKQLSETSSSLWRVAEYLKNAEGCEHCKRMWGGVKEKLEAVSDLIIEEVNRHAAEKRFE
jgi:hypothetical protein